MDWLVATELTHASELVADFHSAHPSRPGPLSSLGIQVENILFDYYTILKKIIWRGRKFDYSKVPSGSGVFAPIPKLPVLGDHSGIGVFANSPTSASDSPGNSPINLLQILKRRFSTSPMSFVFSAMSAPRLNSKALVCRASSTNNLRDSVIEPKKVTRPRIESSATIGVA